MIGQGCADPRGTNTAAGANRSAAKNTTTAFVAGQRYLGLHGLRLEIDEEMALAKLE